MNFHDQKDTIVALATGEAVAALSLIRVSGDKSIQMVDALFSKGLLGKDSHSIHFGEVRDGEKVLDECLVFLFHAPHSFTGEDVVEITCHGSSYIRQRVIQLLLDGGARLAQPGEYSLRAFLNKKMDLSQTEAIADLIYSENEKQHKLAMHQMKGGFRLELSFLRTKLIDFASLIELELDFSEEDVEFANREDLEQLINEIQEKIGGLIQSFQLGNVIKNGVKTVIAGRPNAGKSTLLNALLNEERAIVSDIPGTTRDVVEDILTLNGIKFRLQDTAGIREATDAIESIGVQKAMESIAKSSVLIYVFDANELREEEVRADLEKMNAERLHTIVIANKSDLASPGFKVNGQLNISAGKGEGVEEVKDALTQMVQQKGINESDMIVTNLRHVEALQKAKDALDEVQNGMSRGLSGDLLAVDIRKALFHLGEITGEITTDDLLGNIFANFCIGK